MSNIPIVRTLLLPQLSRRGSMGCCALTLYLRRGAVALLLMLFLSATAAAQVTKWQSVHTVKKKETLFGIARQYGITMEELAESNPEIVTPKYKLKKGATLFIPYPKASAEIVAATAVDSAPQAVPASDVSLSARPLRLSVVLPLHNKNGDGKRMVEYYRGVLMACDSMKHAGMSIDVRAWNAEPDADITSIAKEVALFRPDLIVGPLYSAQVPALTAVAEEAGARLLIPFSINAPQLLTSSAIFQVFQTPMEQCDAAVQLFFKQYGTTCHPVIIDCGDSIGARGTFTTALRRELEVRGVDYSLTSLTTPTAGFQKAFTTELPNVVVLNSSRQQALLSAFGKLSNVALSKPELRISMYGYADWMLYTQNMVENYYKYQVCMPSTFYVNTALPATRAIMQRYRKYFGQNMMASFPRFALTGFDHLCFFLRGMRQNGKQFTGARGESDYSPLQTPLRFQRIGTGGYQNRVMQLIRYTTHHTVEWVEK